MSTSLKKIQFQALLWWVFLNTPEVLQTSQVQQGNFPESGNEGGSPPLETETGTHDVTHSLVLGIRFIIQIFPTSLEFFLRYWQEKLR